MKHDHPNVLLVNEVKKHSSLYDPFKRSCNNPVEREKTWQDVASCLGVEVNDAKTRWRNVRDRFVREKKLLLKLGEGAYYKRDPWPLLEEMTFLWDFIKHRKFGSNGSAAKKRRKTTATALKQILPRPSPEWVNVPLDYDTPDLSVDPATYVIVKGEPKDYEEDESTLRELLKQEEEEEGGGGDDQAVAPFTEVQPNYLTSNDHLSSDSKDEDRLFCLGLEASFKRFTPKMKAFAKWKIQQVLYDVEFSEASSSTQQNTSQLV